MKFSATAKLINLSSTEVIKRNAAVDKQLSTEGLRVDDVVAESNYYFRALSFRLNSTEINYANLHQSIVQHILQLAAAGSSLPEVCMDVTDVTVRCHLVAMGKSGSMKMIVVSTSYLKRDKHVYTYSNKAGVSP